MITLIIPRNAPLFSNGHHHSVYYRDWVFEEAREWLCEHVGPLDYTVTDHGRSDTLTGAVLPPLKRGHWDVVRSHYVPEVHDSFLPYSLAVRLDTDETTAVMFKLRWG